MPSSSENHAETREKTYRAIGRFIFEFSQVEFAVRHHLFEEIELKENYFDAIISSYDVTLLCKIAEEVFGTSRAPENAKAIKKLLGKFHDFINERNRVAHGLWVPSKNGGTVHHASRQNIKSKEAANRADALERMADDLCDLRVKFEQVFLFYGT